MRFSFLFLLLTLCWASCSDEEALWDDGLRSPVSTGEASRAVSFHSSLVQQPDGHWKANRRVPLVGSGRIVDDFANALVTVLSSGSKMEHLIDQDLTNCASFGGGVADAQAVANQLVSVRDLHRSYAAGQRVGFVFKVAQSGLLTLDVLKSFWMQTFLNGRPQEAFGNTTGTDVLKLDLVSVANNDGLKELAFTATKPFDEVQFNVAGISAELLQSLCIYYAFVGENELKTATRGSVYFPDAKLNPKFGWNTMTGEKNVVDADLTNSAFFSTVGGLLNDPKLTVDFGREVPAGSEMGFVISKLDVLSLGVGKSIDLATYDAQNRKVEQVSVTNVLDLSLVSVGTQSRISLQTTKPCRQLRITFHGLEVKVGTTNVYYAYARDEVGLDVSSRFSVQDVTVSGSAYVLPAPAGGTTVWTVVGAPQGTSPVVQTLTGPVTKLTGMTADGDYRLEGVFTPAAADGAAGDPVRVQLVVHRHSLTMGEQCNRLLGSREGATLGDIVGGGSLISLGRFEHPEHLIDDDPDNYATYRNELGLAANVGIGAICLARPVNPQQQPVRVGFTIQNSFDFLGADVLKFFQVRLFLGGQRVEQKIVDKSDVGTVSLVGSRGNRIRMGIRTKASFDRIELWTVGLLNLKLQSFRLYHAYWEDDTADCPTEDIGLACMEWLTAAHGAEINYAHTRMVGLAGVGACTENLGNLIDGDKETFVVANATKVAGENSLAVRFRPLPRMSRIGFVVKAPTGLADVGLLKHAKLEVWSHGARVQTEISGDLLDVDLLGRTGRAYLETQVTKVSEFDEVRLVFPALLQGLDTYTVYGVYTRRDTDGNQIPDCAEDAENPLAPVPVLTAAVVEPHICVGETLRIRVTQGGQPGVRYQLVAWNTSLNNRRTDFEQVLTPDGMFEWPGLEAGEYFIRIRLGGKEVLTSVLEAWVHPLRTVWRTDASTTDWNTWGNWSAGAPWKCTDVVLPSRCVRYPELTDRPEFCANLHLAPRAELVHAQRLDGYDGAWMELTLQPGRSYLLSAPLCETVTGDFFVPAKWQGDHGREAYFTGLTPESSPENRFAPRLFQRFWSSEAPGKVIEGGVLGTTVVRHETDWTAPFNAVAEPIRPGMGWLVRAEAEGLVVPSLTFRFPKRHERYTYFDGWGASTGLSEPVVRQGPQVGRFAFEALAAGGLPAESFQSTVTNLKAGTVFVVGNPFPAHLDLAAFLAANQEVISEVKLTDGNGVHTLLFDQGRVVATAPGFTHAAPLQAFYVTARRPDTRLTVQWTAAMQAQMPGYDLYAWTAPERGGRSAVSASDVSADGSSVGGSSVSGFLADGALLQEAEDVLRITADCDGASTRCVVRLTEDSRLAYHPGEDSRLLYDREDPPAVAVFTVGGQEALDIQQVPASSVREIPLGWQMEFPAQLTLRLSCRPHSRWLDWVLENRSTGERIPLCETETWLPLGVQATQVGQWRLVKELNEE